ncbi:MAG: hypothetical protein ACRDMU_08410 [Gaiellaceae bacterium]
MHRHHRRAGRRYGHAFRGRRFPNREEWLRALEEHQRDLEQEIADVADLIRRLKEQPSETATV